MAATRADARGDHHRRRRRALHREGRWSELRPPPRSVAIPTGRVTLTTDFGTRDSYVAAMKGVIGRISPDVQVLDLSHEIAPQSILEGAFFIAGAMPYFAPGTVHVVVVDPGVGGERRAVAVRAGGQVFVCPDNGLLTLFLRQYPLEEAHALTEGRFMLDTVSATFHGRDVFAPVAAHIARGVPLNRLGPEAGPLVCLRLPEPTISPEGGLRGEVMHVDRFGNLITNVAIGNIGGFREVRIAGCRLTLIQRIYSDVPAGCALALVGSSGYLEVAVNAGSAAETLGAGVGTPVEIGSM